jgi:uncharacterized membrane protein YgcG
MELHPSKCEEKISYDTKQRKEPAAMISNRVNVSSHLCLRAQAEYACTNEARRCAVRGARSSSSGSGGSGSGSGSSSSSSSSSGGGGSGSSSSGIWIYSSILRIRTST